MLNYLINIQKRVHKSLIINLNREIQAVIHASKFAKYSQINI